MWDRTSGPCRRGSSQSLCQRIRRLKMLLLGWSISQAARCRLPPCPLFLLASFWGWDSGINKLSAPLHNSTAEPTGPSNSHIPEGPGPSSCPNAPCSCVECLYLLSEAYHTSHCRKSPSGKLGGPRAIRLCQNLLMYSRKDH